MVLNSHLVDRMAAKTSDRAHIQVDVTQVARCGGLDRQKLVHVHLQTDVHGPAPRPARPDGGELYYPVGVSDLGRAQIGAIIIGRRLGIIAPKPSLRLPVDALSNPEYTSPAVQCHSSAGGCLGACY